MTKRAWWTAFFWLVGLPAAIAGTAIGVHVVGGGGGGGGGGSGTVGPGTVGTIAKFTAADTVDDSVITEDSGNIGIGVATPTSLLHMRKDVNGGTQAWLYNNNSGTTATAQFLAGDPADNGRYLAMDYKGTGYNLGVGYELLQGSQGVIATGSTTNNGLLLVSSSSNAASKIVFGVGELNAAAEAMRINLAKNVSIGTTSDLGQFAVDNGATAESIMVLRDNGSAVVTVSDSGYIQCQDGAVGTPQYSFSGDTNTGIWRPGADVVGIATNGVERLRIGNSGLANSDASVTCAGLTGTVCVADTLGVESSVSSGHPIATIKATATAGQSGVAMYDSGGTRRLDIGYGNSTHSVYASEAVLRTPGGDALQFYNNTTKVMNIQADGYQWVATQGTKPSCSADSHVGRTVLYTKTAGATINPCVCQKVASAYGWAAMGAGGDCT